MEANLQNNSNGGIISLQFAFTQSRAEYIINSWNTELKPVALNSIYIDFGWIIAYVLLIVSFALFLEKPVITVFAVIAGALDFIENSIHLVVLNRDLLDLIPVASVIACAKFLSIIIAVFLVTLFAVLRIKNRGRADAK
jgi:cellulose synthase/poly-beta-1,6-N-acetylglucosamine synthase-like glycosyltransferase